LVFLEAKRDRRDEKCLIVVVMTHGEDDKLYAFDRTYPTKVLWEKFNGDLCPTLAGKPKLFFIQVKSKIGTVLICIKVGVRKYEFSLKWVQ